MFTSLEQAISYFQRIELLKINVDSTFWEPHVFLAKIRRERAKNEIRIFWQNSLLLHLKREIADTKEEWFIFNSNSELLDKCSF